VAKLLQELGLKDKYLALKETMIQSATQLLRRALKSECEEATLVEFVERLCKQRDTGTNFRKRALSSDFHM
jgi:hypothetical protein